MEDERISQKYETIVSIIVVIMMFSTIGLTFLIVSLLKIDLDGLSPFLLVRTLLSIAFLVAVAPTTILGEYLTKQWEQRRFLWRSVIGGVAVFGMFIGATILLLTWFDRFFSKMDVI